MYTACLLIEVAGDAINPQPASVSNSLLVTRLGVEVQLQDPVEGLPDGVLILKLRLMAP